MKILRVTWSSFISFYYIKKIYIVKNISRASSLMCSQIYFTTFRKMNIVNNVNLVNKTIKIA